VTSYPGGGLVLVLLSKEVVLKFQPFIIVVARFR
jgi:hypothetical protein